MIKWLFDHNWKSIKRSPDFQRKVIINVIIGLFVFLMMANFLMIGFFLDRMIKEDILPGSDPVAVINGILIFYFGLDLIFRIIYQKNRTSSGKEYLLLNVSRKKIAQYILIKTLGTLINFFPLLILIPFFINGVFKSNDLIPSLSWLISILSLMIFNTYLANYSKIRFFKNPVKVSLLVGILILAFILEKYKIISFTSYSTLMFSSILENPFLAVIPLLAVMIVYKINLSFLIDYLYLENLTEERKARTFKENFSLLSWLGKTGNLISLDLKMMLRNKRSRFTLYMPVMFVFYGLLFYPSENYNENRLFIEYMLMFIGMFVTGAFILSYGIMVFSFESKYFGFILTKKISMLEFLKAKYYFMLIMSLPVFILSLFYGYFGVKILIVNSLMFLFNIGFSSFLLLYLATFNKIKFDLGASVNSFQGKGSNQFVAIFLILLIIFVLFFPIRLLINSYAGFIFLGIIGLAGLIFHNQILKLLVKQFFKRKYIMSEGFRHS